MSQPGSSGRPRAVNSSQQQQPGSSQSTSMAASSSQNTTTTTGEFAAQSLAMEMSRLALGGDIISVPTVMCINEDAFRSVICKDVFKSISPQAQEYLKRFLPPSSSADEEDSILDAAFSRSPSFNHGNAIAKLHTKIKGGWYSPERTCEQVQLRDNNHVLYDHYIRFYHINLLKKLLTNRHSILQHMMGCPPQEDCGPVPPDPQTVRKKAATVRLRQRASKRARLMVSDCRFKVGEIGVSSDDDDEDVTNKSMLSSNGRTTLYTPQFKDMDLHQPLYMDDIKSMIRTYKRLRKVDPAAPSLDISDIRLEEVYERSGVQSVTDKIRQAMDQLGREE